MTKKELEQRLVEEVSGKQLMEYAEYITREDRESGSPGEQKAAEYFRQVMTAHGLDVDIHYVENYISLPVSGCLRLGREAELSSCITHSYAASTPEEGLTGQAVFYSGTQDVRGRVAVMKGLASAVPCKALEDKGAAAIICITGGDYPFNMSISPIWGQPVPDTVHLLSKIPVVTVNASDGSRLLDYLNAGKDEVFLKTEVSTKFRVVPICVADLKASKPTDQFLMFGGHLDAWHKGGADNGGADAVVLELARVFSHYREHLNLNLRFVWWSGHSNGRYSGSNWYADYHWEDLHANAVVNLDIDTVGTKGSSSFRHIECNKQCYSVGRQIVSERTGQDPTYARIQRNGDQSFWAHGVPTLFECLSLQPESAQGEGTFVPGLPWYWHTICDTFEHLGEEELRRDAQIFAAAIWRFAGSNAYPFSFADLIHEMRGDLAGHQATAGDRFDLAPVAALVDGLECLLVPVDEEIRRLNATEVLSEADRCSVQRVNALSMWLNRVLIPVHYCKNGDLFQVDLAIPIPAFPEFEALKQLAQLSPDTNEAKFLERQLVRERNRVYHYLHQAVRGLEAFHSQKPSPKN